MGRLSHLPTFLLLIGYPVFWLELYWISRNSGQTSFLASILFFIFSVFVLFFRAQEVRGRLTVFCEETAQWSRAKKIYFVSGGVIMISILLVGFFAALYPPHLVQESDALMYHVTLPRQHLLKGNFEHLPWSAADFFYLPVQFALAPYWLATNLPNKFPQFLFFLGMLVMVWRLAAHFSIKNFQVSFLAVLMLMGSQPVGIQLGTAMLDITLCYLFLAALDSFMSKEYCLSAVEFSFFFWAKSFLPLQFGLIAAMMAIILFGLKRFGFDGLSWLDIRNNPAVICPRGIKKFLCVFLLSGTLIGGPFLIKNLYYAGTPVFPFWTGAFKVSEQVGMETSQWISILDRSKKMTATKDQYGSGRSWKAFLQHLWLISVPEKGVNNRYDYPVGMIYLLCLLPFLYKTGRSFARKKAPMLPLFILCFWATWWMGSHQTRFLMLPLILMILCVVVDPIIRTPFLKICVMVAILLTGISAARAHQPSLFKSRYDVLRDKDKALLSLSAGEGTPEGMELDFPDVAFADFRVTRVHCNSVFVLDF